MHPPGSACAIPTLPLLFLPRQDRFAGVIILAGCYPPQAHGSAVEMPAVRQDLNLQFSVWQGYPWFHDNSHWSRLWAHPALCTRVWPCRPRSLASALDEGLKMHRISWGFAGRSYGVAPGHERTSESGKRLLCRDYGRWSATTGRWWVLLARRQKCVENSSSYISCLSYVHCCWYPVTITHTHNNTAGWVGLHAGGGKYAQRGHV
jgi:hypothetical protein